MSLLVAVITTIGANDDSNAGSSFVHHIATPPSVSRSLAVTIDSPAEDDENNVQQPVSPSSLSQLSSASPALGELLLCVPPAASHASSSALSPDYPFTTPRVL